MTSMTIKNMPETLYQELKEAAQENRRSLNNEVITLLEKSLMPQKTSHQSLVEEVRHCRAITKKAGIHATTTDIENAIARESH